MKIKIQNKGKRENIVQLILGEQLKNQENLRRKKVKNLKNMRICFIEKIRVLENMKF